MSWESGSEESVERIPGNFLDAGRIIEIVHVQRHLYFARGHSFLNSWRCAACNDMNFFDISDIAILDQFSRESKLPTGALLAAGLPDGAVFFDSLDDGATFPNDLAEAPLPQGRLNLETAERPAFTVGVTAAEDAV